MARSRNAFGDTWRAFFTLIPFLNLVLLFSKPHEGGPADIRSRAQKIVYNVFGLFVGFTALGAAKSLEATIEKQANRNLEIIMADPALAAKQEMMFMEAAGIEEFLRLAEKNTEMPIQVDELTKMVKITAEGETLKRTFIISTEMEMNDAVRAFIKESTCNEPMLVKMLSMGGSLEEIYTQEDGRMIGSTIVTIADCPVI